jgi:hypothetical protein
MFWVLAAMAVMGAVKGQNEAKATNITNKASTKIRNLEREVSNEKAGATASLNRMTQSIKNNDMLRQGGQVVNKIASQQIELGRQMTTGGFTQRLRAAQEAGALAAASGAAGVGGGSVDMMDNVLDLNAQIEQNDAESVYQRQMFQLDDDKREAQYQMYNSLDANVFQANARFAEIQGPAKLDTSFSKFGAEAGANLLQGMYSSGTFNKGGALDVSKASGGFSGLFRRTFSTGNNADSATGSGFELGSTLL